MFFRTLIRPMKIQKSFNISGKDEFRIEETHPCDENGVGMKTEDGEPLIVRKAVGSYGKDTHHKHLYLKAVGLNEDKTVELSAKPSVGKWDDLILVEMNPEATKLGLFSPNIIMKRGDELSCHHMADKPDMKKVEALPWVVRISAIGGTKEKG